MRVGLALLALFHPASLLQTFSPLPSRRDCLRAAVALLPVLPSAASAKDTATIELAGVTYTKAAMILQMAEQTSSMEGIMKQSALEMETLTEGQREARGGRGEGPGVIARGDMTKSVNIMIANSQLESLPNGREAAATLRGIQLAAQSGRGSLERDEYLTMARLYSAARDDLRRGFESMDPAEQAEARAKMRGIQARDEARAKRGDGRGEDPREGGEAEKLKRERKRIDAEDRARAEVLALDASARGAAAAPRKRTLKELEEAQEAAFGKQAGASFTL